MVTRGADHLAAWESDDGGERIKFSKRDVRDWDSLLAAFNI